MSFVDFSGPGFGRLGFDRPLTVVQAGVLQAHVSHLLSVLVLYFLAKRVLHSPKGEEHSLPFVTAALHIISPAGAFLSAPYGESLFSLLSMTGFYLFVDGLSDHRVGKTTGGDIKTVLAGALFGIATTVRSNGLLSGAMFAYDAALTVFVLLEKGVTFGSLRRLCTLAIGGCLVAGGGVYPQLLAHKSYCRSGSTLNRRSWCDHTIPSIYSWVQGHYW